MCRYILPLPADTITPVQQRIFVTCGLCQIQSIPSIQGQGLPSRPRPGPRTNITGIDINLHLMNIYYLHQLPYICLHRILEGQKCKGRRRKRWLDCIKENYNDPVTCRLKRHFILPTIEEDGNQHWSCQGARWCRHGNKEVLPIIPRYRSWCMVAGVVFERSCWWIPFCHWRHNGKLHLQFHISFISCSHWGAIHGGGSSHPIPVQLSIVMSLHRHLTEAEV